MHRPRRAVRRLSATPAARDAGLALILFAWAASEALLLPRTAALGVVLLFAAAQTLPLAARRRAPIAVALVVNAAWAVKAALGAHPSGGVVAGIAIVLALFGVEAYHRRRGPLPWAGLAVGGGCVVAVTALRTLAVGQFAELSAVSLLYLLARIVGGISAGVALRDRRHDVAALRDEVAVLERRLHDGARDAVGAERLRLEAVLSATVSDLVRKIPAEAVQAARALVADRERAHRALGRIAELARAAGDEMRQTLGVLGDRLAPPSVPALPEGLRGPLQRLAQELGADLGGDVAVRERGSRVELRVRRADDAILSAELRSRIADHVALLGGSTRARGRTLVVAVPLTTPAAPSAPAAGRRRSELRSPGPGLRAAAPVAALALLGVLDQLLAGALSGHVALLGQDVAVAAPAIGGAGAIVLALLNPLPLLWRARAPLAAVGGVAAIMLLRFADGDLSSLTISQDFLGAVTAFMAAAHARTLRVAVAGGLVAVAATLGGYAMEELRFTATQYVYVVATSLALWLAGLSVRGEVAAAVPMRAEAARLRARLQELSARAVALERGRIARELHDVVGHGLSVIAAHAEAARLLLERDPERARASLAIVERAAGGTLDELARLRLALAHDPPAGATAGGAAPLRTVIAEAAAAGQRIDVRIDGDVGDELLGDELGHDLTRIVQEALTNVRKHAGGAAARVEVRIRDGRLHVTVANAAAERPASTVGAGRGAAAAGPAAGGGSGHGLGGMAARARLAGGELHAGPQPHGGWTVHAVLPLEHVSGSAGS